VRVSGGEGPKRTGLPNSGGKNKATVSKRTRKCGKRSQIREAGRIQENLGDTHLVRKGLKEGTDRVGGSPLEKLD